MTWEGTPCSNSGIKLCSNSRPECVGLCFHQNLIAVVPSASRVKSGSCWSEVQIPIHIPEWDRREKVQVQYWWNSYFSSIILQQHKLLPIQFLPFQDWALWAYMNRSLTWVRVWSVIELCVWVFRFDVSEFEALQLQVQALFTKAGGRAHCLLNIMAHLLSWCPKHTATKHCLNQGGDKITSM